MVQSVNFKWIQGEDLNIQLAYKEGDRVEKAHIVPLGAGYKLRMDIVNNNNRLPLYSFESDDQPGSLTNGNPNINLYLPRSLTLSGGALFSYFGQNPPILNFGYDMFLRNTVTDRQTKILKGNLVLELSSTLWA